MLDVGARKARVAALPPIDMYWSTGYWSIDMAARGPADLG